MLLRHFWSMLLPLLEGIRCCCGCLQRWLGLLVLPLLLGLGAALFGHLVPMWRLNCCCCGSYALLPLLSGIWRLLPGSC